MSDKKQTLDRSAHSTQPSAEPIPSDEVILFEHNGWALSGEHGYNSEMGTNLEHVGCDYFSKMWGFYTKLSYVCPDRTRPEINCSDCGTIMTDETFNVLTAMFILLNGTNLPW